MLYSGNEQSQQHNPGVNNNLGAVTATTGQKAAFIILIIITLGLFYFYKISTRNNLRRQQIKINESASGIDIQLNKRFDTLTKLVDATKSQMKFDKEVLENITAYRSGGNQINVNEKQKMLSNMQRGINIAFEAYPNIGADTSIRALMNESIMIEKEIAASRRLYNAEVTRFNQEIYTFPKNVVAEKEQISGIPLFVANEQVREDVKINLNI